MHINPVPLVVLCLLFVAGCPKSHYPLESQIIDQAGTGTIRMSELGGPEWDRIIILVPYATTEAAHQEVDKISDLVRDSGISSREDVCLIVFAKGRTLVASSLVPRSKVDFASFRGRRALPRTDTTFRVQSGVAIHMPETQ